MTIPELLDLAKKAQGFSTDMALAKALGVSRSAVSAWRNGLKGPDTVQAAALAGYTGIPLARVLGIVGEARAISREEKAIWRKLATMACIALCAVGLAGFPQESKAYGFKPQGECILCQKQAMGSAVAATGNGCLLRGAILVGGRTLTVMDMIFPGTCQGSP